MCDRILTWAIAISVGVHIVILGVVGKTSAARPIEVEELKLVRVEVVDVPERVSTVESKPVPRPEPETEPARVSIPPPEHIPTATAKPRRKIEPQNKVARGAITTPATKPMSAVAWNKPAGNPGGELNLGSPSAHGDIEVGTGGRTPVGWVPAETPGRGVGSGTGEGVGKPEPVPDAKPGPGLEPSPAPPPAPPPSPPPPPDVDVRVCAESGLLPGPYCEHVVTRSFRAGKEPTEKCTLCKPKHVSTLADRSEPELVGGSKCPKYPVSARDQGIEGSVTLEYTIDTEGNVVGVKVTKSSGSRDLDRAAMECVQSRKYKPAVQGGIPRNYRKRETFHFSLN